jgi:hypothetical protein
LKSTILSLSAVFIFIGCSGNQPSPKIKENIKQVKKVEPKEEYERTVSYQDIIMKINDINTKKKKNKRVKEIIKEYQYNTSDDDSKNSARKKALNQVKILILEEIGVFVESYLEINKIVENEKYQKYFKQEIKNLTAGIIKTKILDEKYDGKTYYVKASVLVDPDSVSEGISEILKIKANKSEINKLTKLLKSKEKEIDMRSSETIRLQKKVTNQSLLNQAKAEELKIIQLKLEKAQHLLSKYKSEELRIRTRLDEIKNIIKTKTNKAMSNVERGMTISEVREVAGYERTKKRGYSYNDIKLNYGQVWVQIEDDIDRCISRTDCKTLSCNMYGKYPYTDVAYCKVK